MAEMNPPLEKESPLPLLEKESPLPPFKKGGKASSGMESDAKEIRLGISGLPEVGVVFGAKVAGRVVNNRTGKTLYALVLFRQYTGCGPVVLSAVHPDMVVAR